MTKGTIVSNNYIFDMFEERFQDCGNLTIEGDAQVNDEVLESERVQDTTIMKETLSVEDGNIPMEQSMVVYDAIHEELRAKTQLLKKAKKKIQALYQEMSDLQRKFETERTNYLETICKQNQQIKLTNQIIEKIQPLIGREYNYSNIHKIRTKCYWDEDNQKWHIPELVVQKKFPTPGVLTGKRSSNFSDAIKYFDDSSDEEFFRELEEIEEDTAGPSFKRRCKEQLFSLEQLSEPTEYSMTRETTASSDDSSGISIEGINKFGKLMTERGTHSNDKGLDGETNHTIAKKKGLGGLNESTEYSTIIDTIASTDDSSDIPKKGIAECGKLTTECGAISNDKEPEGESTWKQHFATHSDERPFSCQICARTFRSEGSLKYHLRTHGNENSHKCDTCGRTFNTNSALKKHLPTHSAERPYSCEICTSAFRFKEHLLGHLRTHTDERPHKCDICSKSFKRRSDLNKHLPKHLDKRSFKCEICCKVFKKRGFQNHLKTHMSSHIKTS